jgi:hypothetical protein
MSAKPISLRNADGISDSDKVLPFRTMVEFDSDRIAAVIGVSRADLIDRMLMTLSRALAVDAAELADGEMKLEGRILGRDGYPDGWPHEHMAAVTLHRLFPELVK